MKKVLMLLLVICACINQAFSVKCYQCNSQSTMSKCASKQYVAECDKHEVCFEASFELFPAWQYHMRGCTPKTQCNSHKLCGSDEEDCTYKCCTTDMCNSGVGNHNINQRWPMLLLLGIAISFVLRISPW